MLVPSENASSLQLRSLEATIAVLKSKRPHALTEEQKLDIIVAYHSLQAEDAKELLENPEQKPKGHYQQRVAALLGYSTKTVGLAYRDWHHQQEIQVTMPPANRHPKQQRIPKSNDVLLAVCTLVREKRSRNERVVRHVLDLMRQRMWTIRTPKLMPRHCAVFDAISRSMATVAVTQLHCRYAKKNLSLSHAFDTCSV